MPRKAKMIEKQPKMDDIKPKRKYQKKSIKNVDDKKSEKKIKMLQKHHGKVKKHLEKAIQHMEKFDY